MGLTPIEHASLLLDALGSKYSPDIREPVATAA